MIYDLYQVEGGAAVIAIAFVSPPSQQTTVAEGPMLLVGTGPRSTHPYFSGISLYRDVYPTRILLSITTSYSHIMQLCISSPIHQVSTIYRQPFLPESFQADASGFAEPRAHSFAGLPGRGTSSLTIHGSMKVRRRSQIHTHSLCADRPVAQLIST